MKILSAMLGVVTLLASYLCFADNGVADGGADIRSFMRGSTVTVFLNYSQFQSSQIVANNPTMTQQNLEQAIRMTIDRWVEVTGINLKVNYGGTTNKTSPGVGEVLIGATIEASHSGWFASADADETDDTVNGKCLITFYRRSAAASPPEYNWHVFNYASYPSGAVFFHSVFLHEFGHCLGLHHNDNTDASAAAAQIASLRTVMNRSVSVHNSYGPYIEDVEDISAMYGSRSNAKIDLLRSADDGLSFSPISHNLQDLRTSQALSVNRDDDRQAVFYTTFEHNLAYVFSNSTDGDVWSTPHVRAELSLYGVSGSGYDNEYMITWVEPAQNKVRMLYTNDGGSHWSYRTPYVEFKAASTPAIRKIDSNTWIVAYVYLDDNKYKNENGRVMVIISTNDGQSWSSPVEVSNGVRTLGGLAAISNGRGDVRITYVQTDDASAASTSTIATMLTSINANNVLVYNGRTVQSYRTTTQPSVALNMSVWALGYKETFQEITTCNHNYTSSMWTNCKGQDNSYTGIPPALTARARSKWIYMFKEK